MAKKRPLRREPKVTSHTLSFVSISMSFLAVAIMLIGTAILSESMTKQDPTASIPLGMFILTGVATLLGVIGVAVGIRAFQVEYPKYLAVFGTVVGAIGWISVFASYWMLNAVR